MTILKVSITSSQITLLQVTWSLINVEAVIKTFYFEFVFFQVRIHTLGDSTCCNLGRVVQNHASQTSDFPTHVPHEHLSAEPWQNARASSAPMVAPSVP